jgi:hypothetical protein
MCETYIWQMSSEHLEQASLDEREVFVYHFSAETGCSKRIEQDGVFEA